MAIEGRRVLFISYNGMLDPLGQSQVLPYLRALSERGLRFTLLSFERAAAFVGAGVARCNELRRSLEEEGIEWQYLRYHQAPALPATMFDVANGIRRARKIIKRNRIELVHARSHIPATMGLALKRQLGVKLIFDVRGLLADEYVDAGHWRQGSIPWRLTKAMERRALRQADGIVTLTETIWPILKQWEALSNRANVIHEVVPCCADLSLFKFSAADRERRRCELGVPDRFVIVYSGSIDGWYLTEDMADFFAEVLRVRPDAHFLWLTPTRHERIRKLMRERGVDESGYTVLAAAPADVAGYLSASDAGLAFIKRCFSKLASSPTKYAEYLGCGLPLIINSGIGDSDALIAQEGVGALVTEFNAEEYRRAFMQIEGFARDAFETRRRTHAVAERLFDVRQVGVERYAGLYERVLALNGSSNAKRNVSLDTSGLSHL
jgi:glycosyltransferase involved in cell wall biosynthesis